MMKVPSSIRDLYLDLKEKYIPLKEHIDPFIVNSPLKYPGWHYESRIKGLESFALKLETGRYPDPIQLEDFFACTLVVENLKSISKAEELVRSMFELSERRPKNNLDTFKQADSFRFDDLRLYVKWKDSPATPPTGLSGLLFEVQIKTFLQHAWSIATHDLIYKSDEKNWSKERIAYQIKAMLEHAETSIHEAENLAKSNTLNKTDSFSKRISKTIKLINELWPDHALPADKKRLAENIHNLIRNLKIDLQTLNSILSKETELGNGTKILNLSPYGIVIQSLLNQEPDKMAEFLSSVDCKFKVYLHKEINIPSSINKNELKNAIFNSKYFK